MPSIAYLGPKGTFTYQAARQHFEPLASDGQSYTYVPVEHLSDIVNAVHTSQTEYGIIPFENSSNGHVVPTLDIFRSLDPERVVVVAETYLNVHQCLLSTITSLSHVKRVYSHPQSFGQCERYLQANLFNVDRVNVSSTGEAAMLASKDPQSAAIASAASAEASGLHFLAQNIEDNTNNTTRFLVLHAPDQTRNSSTDHLKSLARLVVPHAQPGSLAICLQKFGNYGFNLTSICSRPLPLADGHKWRYVFFFEYEGGSEDNDERIASIFSEVKSEALAEHFCLLGTFIDLRRKPQPS
jgi:prephenate dehydratase